MNNQALAEGLCKYLDWNDEMVAARKETAPNDAAGVLSEVLYGGENVSKLIGGANALILHDAAKENRRLRQALNDVKTYAAGHHADEESCVWLHGLTIDIPTMIEQELST